MSANENYGSEVMPDAQEFRDSLDAIGDAGIPKLAGDIWPRTGGSLAEKLVKESLEREAEVTKPRFDLEATEQTLPCGCYTRRGENGRYTKPCAEHREEATEPPILCDHNVSISLGLARCRSCGAALTPPGGSRASGPLGPMREGGGFEAWKKTQIVLNPGSAREGWDAALASEDEMIAALHARGYRVLREGKLSELVGALRDFMELGGGESDCAPDHHNHCQAHFIEPVPDCTVANARRILAEFGARQ